MALEPLDLQPWVERLAGIVVPQVRAVKLAATAALAKEFGAVAPAIYVFVKVRSNTSSATVYSPV